MFFVNLLEANLKTTQIGKKITYYAITKSTNDDVWELFENGEKEGLVVVSDNQTNGRGQRSNQWFSKPGNGIVCSFLIKSKLKQKDIGIYSILIPIGIVNGINDLLNH